MHNHPRLLLKPSRADIQVTRQLYDAGLLIDVIVTDHLIVTTEGYYSFQRHGLIFPAPQARGIRRL